MTQITDPHLTIPEDVLVAAFAAHREKAVAPFMASLVKLVRWENDNPHSHSDRPLHWDLDNRPGIAGEPCAKCHEFAAARALLKESHA